MNKLFDMKKPYKKIKDLDQAVNRLEKILLDYGDQSSLNDLEISLKEFTVVPMPITAFV